VDALAPLARRLNEANARYVVIGVAGANHFAHTPGAVFTTEDRDLFVPLDPDNLLACWQACEAAGLMLWAGDEPLDVPRDRWLAERVIERRMLTRATDAAMLQIDFRFGR
jgi:hypothetical protein